MTAAVVLERSGCEIISGALWKLIAGKLGAFWGTLEKHDERDKLVTSCMMIVLHGSDDPVLKLFNCTRKQIQSFFLFWLLYNPQSMIQRLQAYPISKPTPNVY